MKADAKHNVYRVTQTDNNASFYEAMGEDQHRSIGAGSLDELARYVLFDSGITSEEKISHSFDVNINFEPPYETRFFPRGVSEDKSVGDWNKTSRFTDAEKEEFMEVLCKEYKRAQEKR